ncbi:MAG TPA: amidohydrolase family protein [Polyangia bacterium]|jgi:cytosine/adenosine deaminase-related metal-dependent hydrolase|nr:amidohydrolase family protein [Polyangia bacterium]
MRIVSARWVVPIDRPPVSEGAIALDDDDQVRMVGARAALRAEFSGAPEERADGVLLPGLVNAHCHLELSALADAVPGGGGFIAWAQRFLKKVGETPRELRRAAAEAAAAGAARFGTAAIGDVGNTLDAAPAIGAAGLSGVLFHELLGSREAKTGDALADAARERAEAASTWPTDLGYVRAPHAPYSVGPDLMRRIFAAASAEKRATSIHVAEDEQELALLRDGTGAWPAMLAAMGIDASTRAPGKSPVEYLASLGAFDGPAPALLVHMVCAGAADRRIAREAGATVVLCPRSNLHIGGRLADVPALLDDGVPIALGTDSLASTPDLSLWGEMATLAVHFPSVPAARWLEAATRGGAEAIGLPAHGTLAPGKRPGVLDVLIDDLAAPVESLVRDPSPTLRWVAHA